MAVNTKRRYYLQKRLHARRHCLEEDAWIAKQAAHVGTALPAAFPHLAALNSAGYSTTDDLNGATTDELVEFVNLSYRDAAAVLRAAAAL